MMKITEEILLNNKFERTSIDYVSIFNRVVYNEMGAVKYSIDMRKGLSNMFGRDWVCHLDNDFSTIVYIDVILSLHSKKVKNITGGIFLWNSNVHGA